MKQDAGLPRPDVLHVKLKGRGKTFLHMWNSVLPFGLSPSPWPYADIRQMSWSVSWLPNRLPSSKGAIVCSQKEIGLDALF